MLNSMESTGVKRNTIPAANTIRNAGQHRRVIVRWGTKQSHLKAANPTCGLAPWIVVRHHKWQLLRLTPPPVTTLFGLATLPKVTAGKVPFARKLKSRLQL